MTRGDALLLEGVSKHYGDFVAVGDVSLRVPTGVIFGLLGPNGAGKSTTLRMVNDISVPDKGTITLFGTMKPGREASERIGYLPEERGLYPKMKVGDILSFFAELRGVSKKDARKRAGFWLERLGIEDWAETVLQNLSKGMQQKVQFATALIHTPELLILDEPWSGLDPINAEVLRDVVLEQKAAGKTVIFSTHLMEQAEKICDTVCILARGRKILDGGLDEVMSMGDERSLAVSFKSDTEKANDWLKKEEAVERFERESGRVILTIGKNVAPAELLKKMFSAGLEVDLFQPISSSLHQVFVDKVGAATGTEREGREVVG